MRHLVIGLLAALALGCGAPPAARAEGFSGAGSTLAYPMLLRWEHVLAPRDGEGRPQVNTENGLDYEAVGSPAGVARIIQRAVDFAATDVSLAPEELERQGLAQFPFVSGGIAVVTNVAGVATGTLRLSGDVLARIYLGRIQRWSDPALAALNPGVTLPDAPINVLRRGDGSGTTQNLTAFLAASNAEWRERFGVQAAPAWLVGVGARGNRALAEAVRATTNSIGYVEASEAARLRLSVALLQNAAGRFVGPAPANLRAALAGTRFDPASHFHLALAAPQGEEAYPLTATIYALVPRQPRSTGRVRRALEFFRLALREGAADATALGFVPLPAPVVAQVEAYWHANIRGAR